MFFSARSTAWRASCKSVLAILLAASTIVAPAALEAKEDTNKASPTPATSSVPVDQLPIEAAETIQLIYRGGPFPYSKDGLVFGNRERLLPAKKRGYYREYTVKTVGARDRGARRIVCGGEKVKIPEACFYTDDHYASFRRIVK